jgi:MFS family permease
LRREKFWAWYTVGVAFTALFLNYGIRYTNTVLFTDIQDELGLSRGQASLPFTISILIYALGAPLVGWAVDRYGPKWSMVAGGAVVGLGLWLCSYMHSLTAFILFFGVIFGLGGNGIGLVPSNTAVAEWFREKLGFALGIATMGIGVGTLLMPVITNVSVGAWGWRPTFRLMAVMVWVMMIPAALLLRRPASSLGESGQAERDQRRGVLRQCMGTANFWLLFFAFVLVVIAMYGVMLHQVPYAKDQGIDKGWAALSVTVVGFTSLVGRFAFGWLSDRTSDRRKALVPAFVMLLVSLVVLAFTRNTATLMLFAAIYGLGYAGYGPVIPALTADLFGVENMGTVFGAITSGGALGGAVGPVITGVIFDWTGTYTWAWVLDMACVLVSIVLIMKIKLPDRP